MESLTITLLIIVTLVAIAFAIFFAVIAINQRETIRDHQGALATLEKDFRAMSDERHNVARISEIVRAGRVNIFTFVRNGETFTIETMGMLGDNIPEWKMKTGLYKNG